VCSSSGRSSTGPSFCRRSTERIFPGAAGAHGIYDKAEIQGAFRDMNTACHHALVDFDSMAEAFGRVSLGLHPGRALSDPEASMDASSLPQS
jgi:hypothetical protein